MVALVAFSDDIWKARESQSLTQAELGERMGVQKSQVSRIESGKSITLASMMRAFRALGVQVSFDMKGIGRVALWNWNPSRFRSITCSAEPPAADRR